jgi:hypothetical protein
MVDKGKINPNNFNYKEELAIDSEALDVEWLMQPQLFEKWGSVYVNAEIEYDKAKEKLEYVKSIIDSRVRTDTVAYTQSNKKPTEAHILSIIITDPEYIQASADYIQAKKSFKSLGIAIKAFEQRKSSLENLVKLHGQSYFASPQLSSERTLTESVADMQKRKEEVQRRIKKRLEIYNNSKKMVNVNNPDVEEE